MKAHSLRGLFMAALFSPETTLRSLLETRRLSMADNTDAQFDQVVSQAFENLRRRLAEMKEATAGVLGSPAFVTSLEEASKNGIHYEFLAEYKRSIQELAEEHHAQGEQSPLEQALNGINMGSAFLSRTFDTFMTSPNLQAEIHRLGDRSENAKEFSQHREAFFGSESKVQEERLALAEQTARAFGVFYAKADRLSHEENQFLLARVKHADLIKNNVLRPREQPLAELVAGAVASAILNRKLGAPKASTAGPSVP